MQTQTSPPGTTNPDVNLPLESLNPCDIDWSQYEDKQRQKQAQKIVDDWLAELQKDVSVLLEKHGIEKYQLSILHNGTRNPMLLIRGGLFDCTKLSVSATNELRGRVAQELAIES